MTIKILNKDTAAKIAAGEVIERPASVVKELIENSLDARASKILVYIKNGGLKSIKVIDDGEGISKNEINLAFERFATSKIIDDSDFTDVRTLGFRGEALPSIASVSKINIQTKQNSDINGWQTEVISGTFGPVTMKGMQNGTSIEVMDLFFNTPARLKFMDSYRNESSKIKSLISFLALTNPNINFELYSDDKRILFSSGNGNLLDIVGLIYGKNVQENMLEISNNEETGFKISGVVSNISLYRGNRGYMFFSVNGRCVQSQKLKFFVEKSYRTLIPERRFPICIINIDTPLGDVDVNVHPAKNEVRFLRDNLVTSILSRKVIETIQDFIPNSINRIIKDNEYRFVSTNDNPSNSSNISTLSANFTNLPLIPPDQVINQVFRLLGQIDKTFIIAEGRLGIFFVDQHAAHERIIYDKILDKFLNSNNTSQQLLDNEILRISDLQKELLMSNLDKLTSLGWEIDDFGQQQIVIRKVPSIENLDISSLNLKDLLVNSIDKLSEDKDRKEWYESMLATIACHSSVRAGQKMANEDMKLLLTQLESTKFPQTCPHGRPTMFEFSLSELKRKFLRP